ncbi:MAG: Zn-ribbon domain-containing OB-fold protein [Alphaproteobacteria bacterium]|jgi:hypothetical protein|nr:Zn-ribbon domain-containing OB-fold protein [Alphaproteobacteria bacterium]MDP6815946.1 Zn-ribbon domain-containing OB-fold protein [Alphaproteobacteria bacterium]
MTNKPLPQIDVETAPFWAGAREGKLLLPHCGDCGRYHFYPRALCPHCRADGWQWAEASGRGVIHTYTIAHRGAGPAFKDDVPYVVAIVELAEGPRMMTNIVTDDLSGIAVDLPVRVVFDAVTDEVTLPKFEPA